MMEKLTLEIDGMSCGHCVGAVRRALEGMDGVQVESVRVGEAEVRYDPRTVTLDAIASAIADEGYQPRGV
ncbi:heavy-metal-associated domain-containing protein [Longimicrobium sp.]|jgi:copper chaperone|uniref:heavy-metal-associated domain-containing protein n=1 Tax=Longimicrobium sp. TaxID=2029185 RepID=UPI002F9229A6